MKFIETCVKKYVNETNSMVYFTFFKSLSGATRHTKDPCVLLNNFNTKYIVAIYLDEWNLDVSHLNIFLLIFILVSYIKKIIYKQYLCLCLTVVYNCLHPLHLVFDGWLSHCHSYHISLFLYWQYHGHKNPI